MSTHLTFLRICRHNHFLLWWHEWDVHACVPFLAELDDGGGGAAGAADDGCDVYDGGQQHDYVARVCVLHKLLTFVVSMMKSSSDMLKFLVVELLMLMLLLLFLVLFLPLLLLHLLLLPFFLFLGLYLNNFLALNMMRMAMILRHEVVNVEFSLK